jgi:diguanylate cyclase (GGDEF)-like protein
LDGPKVLSAALRSIAGRPSSPKGQKWTFIALSALILIYLIGTLTRFADEFETIYLPLVFTYLLILAALGCLGRARRDRRDRASWLLFGLGIGLWATAAISRNLFFGGTDDRPVPAWIDPLFLALYPCAFIGLLLAIRARMRRFNQLPFLDGLAGVLALVALSLTFLHESFEDGTGADALETVVLLAYPLGDLLLVCLIAILLRIDGLRRDGPWILIGTGFALFALADIAFAVLAPRDEAVVAPLWAVWMFAALLIVAGTWRDDRDPREANPGHTQLILPFVLTTVVIVVLLAGQSRDLLPAAIGFALATFVVVVIRLIISAFENLKMFEERDRGMVDELTGLASRRQVNEWIQRRPNDGSGPGRLVMIINVARFKELNAALGPRVGDEILSAVGARLNRTVDGDGELGRLGGDEFILLGRAGEGPLGPEGRAAAISEALAAPMHVDGLLVHVDAYIGAVVSSELDEDTTELVRRADLAVRKAKSREIEFLLYTGAESDQTRERLQLLQDFRVGLDQGQLVLHFQPKVLLADGSVTSTEALVRWRHPDRGLLGPYSFLGMAETAGLMHRVTQEVLSMALDQMSRWKGQGVELGVAVNLAMPNLLDTGLPGDIERQLRAGGLDPADLTMEITENIVMSDPDRVLGNLAELHRIGVRISLDDFGAGNTSLSYLRQLPIDEVKIDRSLVGNMTRSPEDAVVARAAISVTQELGMEVVAEGVEDAETADLLRALGCEEAQGFHFARPMPAEDVPGWLNRFRAARR